MLNDEGHKLVFESYTYGWSARSPSNVAVSTFRQTNSTKWWLIIWIKNVRYELLVESKEKAMEKAQESLDSGWDMREYRKTIA